MANKFNLADAAKVAAKVAADRMLLTALVSKNYSEDLLAAGRGGQPIQVTIPASIVAQELDLDDAESLEYQSLVEKTKTVELPLKETVAGAEVTNAQLTLEVKDAAAQVVAPLLRAGVRACEVKVRKTIQAVPAPTGFSAVYDAEDPTKYFTAARKYLVDNGVAVDAGTVAVVGTQIWADLINAKALTENPNAGSGALRDAEVGKLRGIANVIEHNGFSENEIAIFAADAVTLVTRAPENPEGAASSVWVTEGGLTFRVLQEYANRKNRVEVSTFAVAAVLPTWRETDEGYEEIPHGGVFHVDLDAADDD